MVEGWWSVRHHFTEKWTIGMLRHAQDADHGGEARPRVRVLDHGAEQEVRRRTTSSSTAVEVSRASHVHQTPQVGWPQIEPETIVMRGEEHADLGRGRPRSRSHPGRRVTR